MAKRIFISYRRSDTQHLAGRLADHLSAVQGVDKVFIDVDGIGPGEDFERKICDAIAVSSICIVLIGDQWLGKLDGSSFTAGTRQHVVLAVVGKSLAGESFSDDLNTFPKSAKRFGKRCAVQTLDHLWPADTQSEHKSVVGYRGQAL